MWPEDFSFCHRTVFWWGFVGLQRISFCQLFLILQWFMWPEDFSFCRRTVFWSGFVGRHRISFRQLFQILQSSMWLKISASAAESGSRDDFRVCSESVFVNDFWFCSSLCGKLQPLNRVLVTISGSAANPFSSMISDSAVVYVAWRFQLLP
jgi:hypothetical protein